MSTAEFVSLFVVMGIVMAIVVIPFLVISIIFLNGKGADMIAGFNTMSKEEQAKYDKKAMCRFTGVMTLASIFPVLLMPIGIFLGPTLMPLCLTLYYVIVVIGGLVYTNTSGRFLKQGDDVVVEDSASEKAEQKQQEKYTLIIAGIIAFFPLLILLMVILLVLFIPR